MKCGYVVGWWAGFLIVSVMLCCGRSEAQMVPLYICTQEPLKDGWGATLRGNSMDDWSQRDRVEIRYAPDGVIYAPLADGTAGVQNPLVENGVTSVGSNTGGEEVRPGIFCAALMKGRPVSGDRIFVRVYDAPTVEGAVYYMDSQVMTVSSDPDAVCYAVFGEVLPLDALDTDGDSLPDRTEAWLGSNAALADSDGDGMNDAAEFRAGTSPTDGDSRLDVEAIRGEDDPARVDCAWSAVPGRLYQVQVRRHASDAFADAGAEIRATSSVMRVDAGALLSGNDQGQLRIRLVEE